MKLAHAHAKGQWSNLCWFTFPTSERRCTRHKNEQQYEGEKNTVGTFLMLKLALKEINHWPLAPFIFSPYFDYNQSPDVVCP